VPIVRRHCPKGTIGTWPHCRRIEPQRPNLLRPQTHGSLMLRPLVRFSGTTIQQTHSMR
jgi:hypothetical protein